MSTSRPDKVTLRSYQVGFGDCFLLTFHYPDDSGLGERHVLIDFGTTARPHTAPENLMLSVAENISERCNGKLHAVVATHRHKDHISGFALKEGKEEAKSSGKIIRDCRPDYVIRPWTEDPAADADATGPISAAAQPESARPFSSARFVKALDQMHEVSDLVSKEAEGLSQEVKHPRAGGSQYAMKSVGLNAGVLEQLRFLSVNNSGTKDPANMNAINNLKEMGPNIYTYHGDEAAKTALQELLPGVEVYILGPPTIEQSAAVLRQRTEDDEEFWHLRGGDEAKKWDAQEKEQKLWELHDENRTRFWETAQFGGAEFWQLRVAGSAEFWRMQALTRRFNVGQASPLSSGFASYTSPQTAPAHARWFIRRMNSVRGEQLLEIVRSLDRVLNNTSIILLFKVGDQKLLFPGDAQLENWSYALKDERNRKTTEELLQGVTVYKVGHHGSLNATPQTLWKMIKPGTEKSDKEKFWSVISTRTGKHGSVEDMTEVPRTSLVEELKKSGSYFTTQQLQWGEEAVENQFYKDIPMTPTYPPDSPHT